jgi:hypothetical protein
MPGWFEAMNQLKSMFEYMEKDKYIAAIRESDLMEWIDTLVGVAGTFGTSVTKEPNKLKGYHEIKMSEGLSVRNLANAILEPLKRMGVNKVAILVDRSKIVSKEKWSYQVMTIQGFEEFVLNQLRDAFNEKMGQYVKDVMQWKKKSGLLRQKRLSRDDEEEIFE